MNIKKSSLFLLILSVTSFAVAYVLAKVVPYSASEVYLIALGIIFLLISYILLVVIAKKESFSDWLYLASGWAIILLYIVLSMQIPQDNVQPEAVFIIPMILLAVIFLISSLVSFIRKSILRFGKLNYLGIILSLIPILAILIVVLVIIF